ncbi:MAG TPA: Smr/MutS family protein [Spirochaetota bacterium]|nr:Smr/MutS family protein [Spirochaetota bacterium]HPU88388.1 Smr/MutS family protein [Spirochaetota bacterium]
MDDDFVPVELTDEIDLHAFHPRDVKALLGDFIEHAIAKRYRSVRIVHGKGQSVIKSIVIAFLENDPRVATFSDQAGNWGATIAQLIVPDDAPDRT